MSTVTARDTLIREARLHHEAGLGFWQISLHDVDSGEEIVCRRIDLCIEVNAATWATVTYDDGTKEVLVIETT